MNQADILEGRILVADDEKVNVEFFQVMLTKLGFAVEVAFNGEEVLEKVDRFRPDVLLLDLLMPKLNGFQVTKKLQQNEATSAIPIIVLSAVSDIDKKVDMFELGIYDYIIKPFNFIEILSRIRSAIRHRKLREELVNSRKKLASLQQFEKTLQQFFTMARFDSRFILECLEMHLKPGCGSEENENVTPADPEQRVENPGGPYDALDEQTADQESLVSNLRNVSLDAFERGQRLIESISRLENSYLQLMR
jgi:CheY-like chemotaxis protein